MNKLFLLVLGFLCTGLQLEAQTVVCGRVVQENGQALPGASVFIDGTYDGASSDSLGRFSFNTGEQGAKLLRVEFMGFDDFSQSLILNGDTLRLRIVLKEAFNELSAVTITAGTFEASDRKKAVTISPLDMVTTAGANGDVYGALQTLPGTTKNGESGKLFVKGGDSRESQTYIDGAWVPVPYNSSAPNISTRGRFNPFLFKGMVFSSSGYSAEYGQALSSVLLLNTNDLPEEDQLDLSVLSVGPEVAGTKRWERGAVTATATYRNLSPYMNLVKQNYNWEQAPEALSGALSLQQKTGKSGLWKVYSNLDRGSFSIEQEDLNLGGGLYNFELKNKNSFVNSSWSGMLNEKAGLQTAVSYTDNRDDIRLPDYDVTNRLRVFYAKGALNYAFTDRLLLKSGIEWTRKQAGQDIELEQSSYSSEFIENDLAAFAEAQYYTSNRFVSRVGLRTEYSDLMHSWLLTPRLSTACKLSDGAQLSAAYGWFYQSPEDAFLLRSHDLEPERANHYTITFQSSVQKRILRAELFYKDYSKLVKYDLDENGQYTNLTNSGSGYARGLEFYWRDEQSIKGGYYWISYSYIDSKRNFRDYPYAAQPSFASPHNLSVVYKHWLSAWRSLVSVNLNYSSPRVYNDPNASVFNGEKMKAYRSLDLSWSFLYRQNVIFYASVTNLPGFKNEYGKTFADLPDANGVYSSAVVQPGANRFFVLACFITLTKRGNANQLDKIE